MSRKKTGNGDRKRTGEILFIDASETGHLIDRTHRAFSEEDVEKIAGTYHRWRQKTTPSLRATPPKEGNYRDTKGFCKSTTLEEARKHNFVLTPGRYVGIPDEIDDGIPFEDKMAELTSTLAKQMAEEKRLDEEIKKQLVNIGFSLNETTSSPLTGEGRERVSDKT